MEQIFALMTLLGGVLLFMCSSMCVKSIDLEGNPKYTGLSAILTLLSTVSFVIGLCGLILIHTI